ncbi:MAG: hypothetical protein R2697_01100 [Ilumatobacteraceae bacterium]
MADRDGPELPAEGELRRRLWEIDEEIASTPSTEFGRRADLHRDRDAIVEQLRELAHNPTISDRWADHAGQRPSEFVQPVIVSPGEGGGG